MNRMPKTTEQSALSYDQAVDRLRGVFKQLAACDGEGNPVYTPADLLFKFQGNCGGEVLAISRGINERSPEGRLTQNDQVMTFGCASRALVEVLRPEFPKTSEGLEMVQRELLGVWLTSARGFIAEEDLLRSEQKREVEYWAGTLPRLPARPNESSW